MNSSERFIVRSIAPAIGLALATPVVEAATPFQPADALLWLFDVPNGVLAGMVIALSSALALVVQALLPSGVPGTGRQSSRLLAGVIGALAGALLAISMAGPWQDYVARQVTSLPPTAAGTGSEGMAYVLPLLGEPGDEALTMPAQTPAKVMPGRARHTTINFEALEADTLRLNLFDDASSLAVRDRIVHGMLQSMEGGDVWVGHLAEDPESEVILVNRGRALMGTIESRGKSFEIVPIKDGIHAVRELDRSKTAPRFEPENLEYPAEGSLVSGSEVAPNNTAANASGPQTFDLLVAYTARSRANAGGISAIETRVINAVSKANQAYLNSRIPVQLNLVKMVETPYAESGDMALDRSRLQARDDGYLDDLHALRDQFGADLVVLVNANQDVCGTAPVMTRGTPDFAAAAFMAVHDDTSYNCLGSNNALAHLLGHIQGNVHDVDHAPSPGASPDAFGYRVCGVFRDIMAYPCQDEPGIPYFSSADTDLTYGGQPIGVAGSADAARSMRSTAAIVAGFRNPPAVISAPLAPTDFLADEESSDGVSLSWTDAAGNETGYRLERSMDGYSWMEIAALPANTQNFIDTGLPGGKTVSYRIHAWNSLGASSYLTLDKTRDAALPTANPGRRAKALSDR